MFVFSNLATSLDGKIAAADRAHYPLGTQADFDQMIVLRKRCDVVLMGASSLRAYRRPCGIPQTTLQPVNAVLSSTLAGISPEWPFFQDERFKRVLFVSHAAPAARIRKFSNSCVILKLSKPALKRPIAREIIAALETIGAKRLLVEGGGSVMWEFVSQNLIDEYHVTITPKIVGGAKTPTLVDGTGFPARRMLNLTLKSCKTKGDEIFLVYGKTQSRG